MIANVDVLEITDLEWTRLVSYASMFRSAGSFCRLLHVMYQSVQVLHGTLLTYRLVYVSNIVITFSIGVVCLKLKLMSIDWLIGLKAS